MQEKKIYILTGAIQSGKTTTLMQWSSGRDDVFGILTPVADGKRIFMDVHSGEQFDMEAGPGEKDSLTVGKFAFSKKAFEKAVEILRGGIKEKKGWLLIDEIGPLELRGEGLSDVVNEIPGTENKLHVILVIRESLVDKTINFFQLSRQTLCIIYKESDLFR